MNIGIDFDGVLTNDEEYIMATLYKYCVEHNLEMPTDNLGYEFRKKECWSMEDVEKYREEYFDSYAENYPPRLFAKEVIDKLRQMGHRIILITGRNNTPFDTPKGEMRRKQIFDWLEKYNIKFDKIVFAIPPKIDELKENEIDVMIEDSPITIPQITDTVKVLCYDDRYNRHISGKNVIRVYCWYDIYDKIVNNKI
ncbi:MAG: hypothetical protein IKB86_03680 [Clostridia bacterium]|nr:hypothetical protein [Clostridia bacterium]